MPPDSSTRLPSWVPDWRFNILWTLIQQSFVSTLRIFNASLSSSVDYDFSNNGESEILSLSGFQLSTIDALGDSIATTEYFDRPADLLPNNWQLLAQKVSADPVIFWLTCVEERLRSKRMTSQQRKDFSHYIQNWISSSQTERWPSFKSTSLDRWIPIHKRFFICGNTRMGRCPNKAQVGDLICILFGAQVPFVLRKRVSGVYIVVGECYVHGIYGWGSDERL